MDSGRRLLLLHVWLLPVFGGLFTWQGWACPDSNGTLISVAASRGDSYLLNHAYLLTANRHGNSSLRLKSRRHRFRPVLLEEQDKKQREVRKSKLNTLKRLRIEIEDNQLKRHDDTREQQDQRRKHGKG